MQKKSGRMAGDWLTSFMEYTEGTESPRFFYWWSGIATIAGALQRRVYFRRGILDQLYPNFYIILVGPAGGRKESPVNISGRFLRAAGVDILHGTTTPEGLMFQLRARKQPIRKVQTKEELTDTMKTKFVPECIGFLQAKELSSLFSSRNYVENLIVFLTDVWDCHDEWDYTTKIGGRVPINKLYINLLGASNPDWLAKCFREDSFGGGFMGRTIFVYQSNFGKIPPSKLVKTERQRELELLMKIDLQHIAQLQGAMSFTADASKFFDGWYMKQVYNPTGRMARYHKTKHVHLQKLAMIVSISESDELLVTTEHLAKALKVLDSTEKMMPEAFAYVGVTNEARVAQLIIELLKSKDGQVGHQELSRHVRKFIRSRKELNGILEMLMDSGMISVAVDREKKTRRFLFTKAYKQELEERQKAQEVLKVHQMNTEPGGKDEEDEDKS